LHGKVLSCGGSSGRPVMQLRSIIFVPWDPFRGQPFASALPNVSGASARWDAPLRARDETSVFPQYAGSRTALACPRSQRARGTENSSRLRRRRKESVKEKVDAFR